MRTVPVTRAMGLVSCMRFRQRTNVLLPQPDGPIRAVAWFGGDMQIDVLQRVIRSVPRIQVDDFNADAHVRISPC